MSIPNIISLLRILFIPVIIATIFIDFPNHYYIALILYLVVMISDLVDGFIARKYKTETKLGRFLDPLADKLLNILMMVTLTYLQIFPLWIVLLQIARDLVVDAIINLQASLKMFSRAITGAKIRTFLLTASVAIGILALTTYNTTLIEAAYYLLIVSFVSGFIGVIKPTVSVGKKILNKWEG